MIIRNRGITSRRLITRIPKSSIPQRETSIHLDLQVLYSKKNMLDSNVRVWSSKLELIEYELENVKKEIQELEAYAKKLTDLDGGAPERTPIQGKSDIGVEGHVKIVEMEY